MQKREREFEEEAKAKKAARDIRRDARGTKRGNADDEAPNVETFPLGGEAVGSENVENVVPSSSSSSWERPDRPKRKSDEAGIDPNQEAEIERLKDEEEIRKALLEIEAQNYDGHGIDAEMEISSVEVIEEEISKWINEVEQDMGDEEMSEKFLINLKKEFGIVHTRDRRLG